MASPYLLALPYLYQNVQTVFSEDFAPDPMPVQFAFGWREPMRQDNQGTGCANRVVFEPGDDGNSVGADAPAKWPGGPPYMQPDDGPRPLATLFETFRVYLWAYDGNNAEDELAQYAACRFLYDAFRRAAYLSAVTTFAITGTKWLTNHTQRRFGAEMVLTCTIQSRIPDSRSDSTLVRPVESSTVIRSSDVTEVVNTPIG
jgi:hypothetical protein